MKLIFASSFCWFLLPDWFLLAERSRGATIAAGACEAVVDLKLEVKRELFLTHFHFDDRGSNTRSGCLKVKAVPLRCMSICFLGKF